MLTAILSFLGGNVFRLLLGELFDFLRKRQEHSQELDRIREQRLSDAAAHAQRLEVIRLEADKGLQVLEAQRVADMDRIEGAAWSTVVEGSTKLTGLRFIDYWNQSIRPALATLAAFAVVGEVIAAGFILSEWHQALVGSILGIYVANRDLSKRGK